MKAHYLVFYSLLLVLFSSFEISEECEYAGSNMGYIKTQTQKAITATNVNESHFKAYKALNAMEKSQKLFDDCGCTDAYDYMKEALKHLKSATRAITLNETRLLLNKSLENTIASIAAIEDHEEHRSSYGKDVLALNTVNSENTTTAFENKPKEIDFKQKIDISLISYEASLQTVVETVECKEAYAFAMRIYNHCEAQLLKEDLSEGKKYYNLRTKDITKKALDQIGDCMAK
ncbi:hypothetical protein [Aurantibacter sp.]|uniref:hypothetical protein n=1 Tax=Aurantibacter sp. TaxID=2807103 RepID=UPI0032637679